MTPLLPNLRVLGVGDGAGRQLLYSAALIGAVFALRALVTAALRRTRPADRTEHRAAFDRLRRRYFVADRMELPARVYLRMTDNWLEVTLRFLSPVYGVRNLKDAMTRDILVAFEEAGLTMASTTIEVTGLPTLRVARAGRAEAE